MNKALVAIIFVILAGCASSGGGGGGPPVPPPTTLRTDLLYGYYGDEFTETSAHTNLFFALTWDDQPRQLQQMVMASAAGFPIMVDMAAQIGLPFIVNQAEVRVRARFQQFKDAGIINSIVAVYPLDEPDLHNLSGLEVSVMNTMVRQVAAEFGIYPKIAVVYTNFMKWPGVESADLVGFDSYDAGAGIFNNGEYAKLKAVLKPSQKIILVPGGSSHWKTDPTQFFNMAQQDLQVCCLIPFAWRDFEGMVGIKNNGMINSYRSVGQRIKTPQ